MDALNKPCWYMADEMKPEPEPHCRFHSIGYCRIDRSRELKEELLGTGGAVEEEANGAVVGGAEDVALPEQRRVPFLERDRPHVDRREARGQAHGRRQNKHRHGSPAREHPHHQPYLSLSLLGREGRQPLFRRRDGGDRLLEPFIWRTTNHLISCIWEIFLVVDCLILRW
jgi:hypothetical protein